jgi:glutathione S-transferase
MTEKYSIYGNELSPYSVKVRSYFRYKKIEHEWIERNLKNQKAFNKLAKIQIIPLVHCPDGVVLQDSTPIILKMEEKFKDRPVVPAEPALSFLSRLMEEYADEWAVKHMCHYRWHYEENLDAAGKRFAKLFVPETIQQIIWLRTYFLNKAASTFKARMSKRLWVIGSNEVTGISIEESFKNLIVLLNEHLGTRPYIFGKRPSIADFALWGHIYNLNNDVTGHQFIQEHSPKLNDWIERMINPEEKGDFETWNDLKPTLLPLIKEEIAETFLPWVTANNDAVKNNEDKVSLTLNGRPFEHRVTSVQKFHAKSFKLLMEHYETVSQDQGLEEILTETGAKEYLNA